MSFNSYQYIIFLLIILIVYYIISSRKGRSLWLLLCSYFYFASWSSGYLYLIILIILVSYVGACTLEKARYESWVRKGVCIGAIGLSLSFLLIFKYFNFVSVSIIRSVNSIFGTGYQSFELDLLLPIGISYYTFQAISYLIDVYNDKVQVEKI